MRKILFRGRLTDKSRWVYGCLLNNIYGAVPAIMTGQSVDDAFNLEFEYDHVEEKTVGQSTGLKDKNGKKIFEGDICRNTKTGEIVSVQWHGTMAGFVWSKRQEKSHLFDFGELFRAYDKYEVIGNIHDNPELLGGGG